MKSLRRLLLLTQQRQEIKLESGILKCSTDYSKIEMWISILRGFCVSDVFELGLDLLNLYDLGFFVFEVLKGLDEGLQSFAKNSYSFTKIYESLQLW